MMQARSRAAFPNPNDEQEAVKVVIEGLNNDGLRVRLQKHFSQGTLKTFQSLTNMMRELLPLTGEPPLAKLRYEDHSSTNLLYTPATSRLKEKRPTLTNLHDC